MLGLLRTGVERRESLRRSERLPAAAAAADPRAQQHLGHEQQLGSVAAIRATRDSSTTARRRSRSIRRRSGSRRRSTARCPRRAARSFRLAPSSATPRAFRARPSVRSIPPSAPTTPGAPTARTRNSSGRTRSRWAPTTGRSASTCSTRVVRAGASTFDKEFTSATGLNNNSTTDGNAYASFLLGYPSGDGARQSTMTLTDAARHLHELLRRLLAGRLARELEVHLEITACGSNTKTASTNRTTTSRSGSIQKATSAISSVVIPASIDPSGATPAHRRARPA